MDGAKWLCCSVYILFKKYIAAENEAREAGLGIWSADFELPQSYRRSMRKTQEQLKKGAKVIKIPKTKKGERFPIADKSLDL